MYTPAASNVRSFLINLQHTFLSYVKSRLLILVQFCDMHSSTATPLDSYSSYMRKGHESNTALGAVAFYACYYRRRKQHSKEGSNDSEKGDAEKESKRAPDSPGTVKPGFFSKFRIGGQKQPINLEAAAPQAQQNQPETPRKPDIEKPNPRAQQVTSFMTRALPWRGSQPKTSAEASPRSPRISTPKSPPGSPSTPLSPARSNQSFGSTLSDHAAKAAQKYKDAAVQDDIDIDIDGIDSFEPVKMPGMPLPFFPLHDPWHSCYFFPDVEYKASSSQGGCFVLQDSL